MGTIKTYPFDATKYLKADEDLVELLQDAFGTGELPYIRLAILHCIKVKGATKIAQATGLNRQALYQAFGKDGNPTIHTVVSVLAALDLGVRLGVSPLSGE